MDTSQDNKPTDQLLQPSLLTTETTVAPMLQTSSGEILPGEEHSLFDKGLIDITTA